MCSCGDDRNNLKVHTDYVCLTTTPKVDVDPALKERMERIAAAAAFDVYEPRFAYTGPDGRSFESVDGFHWRVITIRGPWRADECMAFGHEPDHDGLCARCCGRCEEAGE